MGRLIATNLKILFGRRILLLLFFIVPLILSFVVNYVKFESKPEALLVAISDEDNSEASSQLLNDLGQGNGIKLIRNSPVEAQRLFDSLKVESVIFIRKGFQKSVDSMEGKTVKILSQANSVSGGVVTEIVGLSILKIKSVEVLMQSMQKAYDAKSTPFTQEKRDEVRAYFLNKIVDKASLEIKYETYPLTKSAVPNVQTAFYTGGFGVFLVFMMMISIYSSDLFCRNIENGVLVRGSTIKRGISKISIGLIISLFIVGSVQILIFCASLLFQGSELSTTLIQFVILMISLLIFILIGFFLSALLQKKEKLHIAAFYLSFLSGLAGGCFFNVGTGMLKAISIFTPQGFVLNALEKFTYGQVELSDMLGTIGFAAVAAIVLYLSAFFFLMRGVRLKK
ncbi:MAG: ABC transporter permease [Bacillota bacterium]